MYLILLAIIMLLSAIMDVCSLDVFGQWAQKKYEQNPTKLRKLFWDWTKADSWQNKYKIADLFYSWGVPRSISNFIGKDVLVIFSDLWHFAKALMMAIVQFMVAQLTVQTLSFDISVWLLTLILFILGGSVFNFFYYNLRKIK